MCNWIHLRIVAVSSLTTRLQVHLLNAMRMARQARVQRFENEFTFKANESFFLVGSVLYFVEQSASTSRDHTELGCYSNSIKHKNVIVE